ncbi:protein translocase subunit SecD [bacterium]|nr:protein translocase subunit SecD [bacterium]
MPSVTGSLPDWWKKKVDKIHLGLDLQGGMHLVLGVKLEKAIESHIDRTVSALKDLMRDKGIVYDEIRRTDTGDIEIKLVTEEFVPSLEKIMDDYLNFDINHPVGGDNTMFRLSLKPLEKERVKDSALNQALETIRNRIDQFGVSEPTIQKQGDERIVVEMPGIKDTKRAIDLIGKTAQLEFKLVDDDSSLDEALKGNIPSDCEILYERTLDKGTGKFIKKPYLIKKRTLMTGDVLTDAEVKIGGEYGESYVAIAFDKPGARLFEQITAENVGRRLAIILDKNVYSAPVIREKIAGGHAQITGRFTTEDAHDLAIVLRAGALPAPVEILHQQSVGPSLGYDSIKKGLISMLFGFFMVVVFMVVYYRLSGFVADLALILNIVLIMAVLSLFRATLTLPGIAGIVLTIGMAVDANVLIFERIREELEFGKTVRAAISSGYSKAFITILDANITTLVAAVVLFQFGTGPIKGFAVTLSIGILASMFTAIFVSRFVFDWFMSRRKISTLSI